ncbi:hypothetical protein PLICRDRAFT_42365 [Plicaturopsis crispa FD-325 SS-3]|nr:hypothetical protein PLICRDRAFT_42365 [Plicaturopsis crispa FD-325 SS-3]
MAALHGTIRADKKALRKAMAASLRLLPQSALEIQSRTIADRVLRSAVLRQCRSVSCYLSMPSGEVGTTWLVSEILRAGKTVFIPRIDQTTEGRMEFLKLYGEEDLHTLPSGVWGIREPDQFWKGHRRLNALDVECEGLDLILVPGVAFDRSLSRLGHGKGYYDRFISSYASFAAERGLVRPSLVALVLREQLLDAGKVPIGDNDWKMDMIITPDEDLGDPPPN